jgi:hypothetical protein
MPSELSSFIYYLNDTKLNQPWITFGNTYHQQNFYPSFFNNTSE